MVRLMVLLFAVVLAACSSDENEPLLPGQQAAFQSRAALPSVMWYNYQTGEEVVFTGGLMPTEEQILEFLPQEVWAVNCYLSYLEEDLPYTDALILAMVDSLMLEIVMESAAFKRPTGRVYMT